MALSVSARRYARALARAAPVVVAAALLGGCGASGSATQGRNVIAVTERDFAIVAPKQLPAGNVVFRVANTGPVAHELLVVRAPADGALPMRTDGLTVDEDRLTRSEAGVLEPADAHAVRNLSLDLTPGRYVLFCNMSGHFLGGMHRVLIVR
jgi:uncharacterized cupredoxin-like copper-binding protein